MIIPLPVTTAVLEQNEDLRPTGKAKANKIIIEFDTRQRDYHKLFQLKRSVEIRWINERTFDVQELSGFSWPLIYRITPADGYYTGQQGQRVYFTPQIAGLSTLRKVSEVVMRLGLFLCIISGLGARQASWLMQVLFQITVSKSAIDRWVDEHGRIIATQEVAKRDEEHVKPFLERMKQLGLEMKAFYIDHWQAYANAIKAVYPQAHIQLDYFHILQNIWRKVWDEFRAHRRDLKERSEAAQTKRYAEKLKGLVAQLWKNRYLFFKSEEKLTAQEKETMQEVLQTQSEMSFLRGFLHKVWAIFEGSTTAAEAQEKLAALKQYAAHHENDGDTKSNSFLEDNFTNMTTFLRAPGVQRNSLAETGMRTLRRLERNHDGLRSEKGRRNAIKVYQAITYLGWNIHNPPNLTTSSG